MTATLQHALTQHARWLDAGGFKFHYDPCRERTAVIVEPRRHDMLRAVVANVMSFLGDDWNLHVFTAAENKDWLRDTLAPYEFSVNYLNLPNLTRDQYSELLMTPAFWETLKTEHVLIFQTDVMVFRPWNPVFEEYDYVGANYYHPDHVCPGGSGGLEKVGGIQGGLSYRKRSAMLACLSAITAADVVQYRKGLPALPEPMVEDIYFTHACAMLQKALPSPAFRHFFSIEAVFYPTPFGFHGWNRPYFTEAECRELLWGSAELRKWAL
jgi:hypothetical protein